MATTLVLCGTRPEAIKLFPVVHALRARGAAVRVCATGQHRDLTRPVLDFAGIVPDATLDVMATGQSLDTLVARLLDAIGTVLAVQRPDRVVVQGDTATALAGALAALHARIPVAHVEAGLRSGDMAHPWPEEGYRRLIAPLADLQFAPTPAAAGALVREGIDRGVHVTGNTVIDALLWTRSRLDEVPGLAGEHIAPALARFAHHRRVLVTTHRRETWAQGDRIVTAADAILRRRPDVALIWPLHPHPAIGAAVRARLGDHPRVACLPPLGYPAFVAAMAGCELILTDSGGVQEEAPALGRPVLVMRETTERPEGLAAGGGMLVGTAPAGIADAAVALLDDPRRLAAMATPRLPFGDGRAAERIAALILGNEHAAPLAAAG